MTSKLSIVNLGLFNTELDHPRLTVSGCIGDYLPMTESEIEWKVSESNVRMRMIYARGTRGTSQVRARWYARPGAVLAGPSEVTIHAVEAGGGERRRGVTTGVLRDAEPLLVRMTAELPEQLDRIGEPDHAQELVQMALEGMPESPRKNPDLFYRGLLDLNDALVDAGHTAPVDLIAKAMNVPKETVKTRLRVARSRVSSQGGI